VNNLGDAIDQAKNGNPILCKFIRFPPYKDNTNIGLSDKDQELVDKLKLPDFMEKKKSTFLTLPPNPSRSSTNYKKPAVEIPSFDID
jgi:hypothetical protein